MGRTVSQEAVRAGGARAGEGQGASPALRSRSMVGATLAVALQALNKVSLPVLLCVLAVPAALVLGIAIGRYNPAYGAAAAGCLALAIMALFRLDELAIAAILAVHLYVDWYLGLHLVAILLALILLLAFYFGQSKEHPFIRPRMLWLWILFLTLTIYPAINGGQYMLYDLASYYPSDIFGALLFFWLGNIIARDINVVRRAFQFLAALGVLVALHTIIQSRTGVFLFSSARADALLVQVSNYDIIGTNANRVGSFFIDPNWDGAFLAMLFFLPLGLFIECKLLAGKLLYLIELSLILSALLFTYSNSAWIALLGGLFAYIYLVGKRNYRLFFITFMAIVGVVVMTIFPSELAIQLQRATGANELSLRLGAWETGIRVMEAFPVFGVGLGNQAYLLKANPYRVLAQFVPLPHPHNAYIQWGAMAGIPVLLVFLLLLGYAFRHSWRGWIVVSQPYRPLLGGGLAAMVALSVNSISLDGWTNAVQATIGWLMFGLLSSPLWLKKEKTAQRRNEANEDIAEQCE